MSLNLANTKISKKLPLVITSLAMMSSIISGGAGFVVSLLERSSAAGSEIGNQAIAAVITTLIAGAIATFLGLRFSKSITMPIDTLNESMRKLADGDANSKFQIKSAVTKLAQWHKRLKPQMRHRPPLVIL